MKKLKKYLNKALDFLKIDKKKTIDVLIRTGKTGGVVFLATLLTAIAQKGFTAFDATLITALSAAGTAILNYLIKRLQKEVPEI